MKKLTKKHKFAADLFGEADLEIVEAASLQQALVALRQRKLTDRVQHWALPFAAAAAGLVLGFFWFAGFQTQELAREEIPAPTEVLVVTSRPYPEGTVLHSGKPFNVVVRSSDSSDVVMVVKSVPSERLEFLNDEQLLAALGDRPVMLTEDVQGNAHLIFLRESDKEILWKP